MRLRLVWCGLVSGGLALSSQVLIPGSPAFASTSCYSAEPSGHCYGIMVGDYAGPASAAWGADVRLNDPCFADDDYSFANEEIWANTNGATTGGNFWVEVGMKAYRSSPSTVYNWEFFWADQKPSGYYEHRLGDAYNPSLNANHTVSLSYIGSNKWNVWIEGTKVGTNTANPGPSYGAQAGLEVRYLHTSASGSIAHAYHRNYGSSTKINGWGNASSLYLKAEGTTVSWNNGTHHGVTNSRSNSYCPATLTSAATRRSLATPSASVDPEKIAVSFAASNGDADPKITNDIHTTRGAALVTMGDGDSVSATDSAIPVDVVNMEGDFDGSATSTPPGGTQTRGTDLTVVLDSSTGHITDWSLTNAPPDLDRASGGVSSPIPGVIGNGRR